MGQKTIQELFTLDYGRMNATLGTELPNVNFTNQTTIPLGYVDPATEIIRQGNTQLWKITHNGVDTHFIHFHLFNVQVINRVGWDGSVRPIDANEAGWKDTVRMNPLEDIAVALQPITPTVPFPLANSVRLTGRDAPEQAAAFSNLNPLQQRRSHYRQRPAELWLGVRLALPHPGSRRERHDAAGHFPGAARDTVESDRERCQRAGEFGIYR